jgi:hypothetical protein
MIDASTRQRKIVSMILDNPDSSLMALNAELGDRQHLHADIKEVRTIRNIVQLVLDEQARRRL